MIVTYVTNECNLRYHYLYKYIRHIISNFWYIYEILPCLSNQIMQGALQLILKIKEKYKS